MLLKKGYIAPGLKSSLTNFYGHHQHRVDCYKISISQKTWNSLPLRSTWIHPLFFKHYPMTGQFIVTRRYVMEINFVNKHVCIKKWHWIDYKLMQLKSFLLLVNKHTCVYITNIQLHAILMSTYIYINTIINNRIDQKRLALILY